MSILRWFLVRRDFPEHDEQQGSETMSVIRLQWFWSEGCFELESFLKMDLAFPGLSVCSKMSRLICVCI